MRAVSSARSTYRPIQNSDSAMRLSMRATSGLASRGAGCWRCCSLLAAVPVQVGDGRSGLERWAGVLRRRVDIDAHRLARRGRGRAGQHPGVLGAAAARGVDDELALGERDAGEPAGQHPHLVAVVDGEGAQVDVPRTAACRRRRSARCESWTTGWAIQVAWLGHHLGPQLVELGRARRRPDHDALAAGAVDRLDDQLVEAVHDLLAVRRRRRVARCRRCGGPAPRRGSSGSGRGRRCRSSLSSATPLPTALASITLPARAALSRPEQPSSELLRKCTGSRNSSSTRR